MLQPKLPFQGQRHIQGEGRVSSDDGKDGARLLVEAVGVGPRGGQQVEDLSPVIIMWDQIRGTRANG